jgi:hypothetical protein
MGPHEDHLTPSNLRENAISTVLLFFAILFGVFPQLVLQYMDKTIDQQTQQLADWTAAVKEAPSPAVSQTQPATAKPVAIELPGAE